MVDAGAGRVVFFGPSPWTSLSSWASSSSVGARVADRASAISAATNSARDRSAAGVVTVAASSSSSHSLASAKRRAARPRGLVDAVPVRAPVLGAVAHEREAARVRDVREVRGVAPCGAPTRPRPA